MIAILVILTAAAALAVMLPRGRPGRDVRVAVAVTLVAGLSAYAATGRPLLPAAPPQALPIDRTRTLFETERQARLPRFGPAAAWLTFADALLRADGSAMAIRGLRGEIDVHPSDVELWIGLGHALAVHAGRVGDASRLAFDRAAALAPDSPHPAFFLGLTQFETGDRAGAAATWRALKGRALPVHDLDAWITRAER
ncbi:tetratricopeptide repeat protein [Glacieibacterium frigidum]|uniref:Cytochrome c biogenesis factor n=1 Tax=Glacieibacterium frigidum TaxID=2593303 RepID=A0A552U9X0_9SPHN|nr:hypothetical protein [Glacieibacterium frigidum]TRW15010.1 hypothetical protein FMM06_15250 [Glacieibacterium frigidum]